MIIAKKKRVKALEKQLKDNIERIKDTAFLYGEGSLAYKNSLIRREELELLIRSHEIFIAEKERSKSI